MGHFPLALYTKPYGHSQRSSYSITCVHRDSWCSATQPSDVTREGSVVRHALGPFLWTFDLAMVSILQDFVPVHWRGKAAALQAVACELFELLIAAAAVALPSFEQFWALAGISFAAVCTSGIIFWPCALLLESRSKDTIPVHEYAA